MPSPDGCFVRVWDQPAFEGASSSSTARPSTGSLRDLPRRQSWNGRIRSLTLGPAASSAMAWSDEQFKGRSLLVTAVSREQGRVAAVPLEVESLDINCATQAADATQAAN